MASAPKLPSLASPSCANNVGQLPANCGLTSLHQTMALSGAGGVCFTETCRNLHSCPKQHMSLCFPYMSAMSFPAAALPQLLHMNQFNQMNLNMNDEAPLLPAPFMTPSTVNGLNTSSGAISGCCNDSRERLKLMLQSKSNAQQHSVKPDQDLSHQRQFVVKSPDSVVNERIHQNLPPPLRSKGTNSLLKMVAPDSPRKPLTNVKLEVVEFEDNVADLPGGLLHTVKPINVADHQSLSVHNRHGVMESTVNGHRIEMSNKRLLEPQHDSDVDDRHCSGDLQIEVDHPSKLARTSVVDLYCHPLALSVTRGDSSSPKSDEASATSSSSSSGYKSPRNSHSILAAMLRGEDLFCGSSSSHTNSSRGSSPPPSDLEHDADTSSLESRSSKSPFDTPPTTTTRRSSFSMSSILAPVPRPAELRFHHPPMDQPNGPGTMDRQDPPHGAAVTTERSRTPPYVLPNMSSFNPFGIPSVFYPTAAFPVFPSATAAAAAFGMAMPGFGVPVHMSENSAFAAVVPPEQRFPETLQQKQLSRQQHLTTTDANTSSACSSSASVSSIPQLHSPTTSSSSYTSPCGIQSTIDAVVARTARRLSPPEEALLIFGASRSSIERPLHIDLSPTNQNSRCSSDYHCSTATASPASQSSGASSSAPASFVLAASDPNAKCAICEDRASGFHYACISCEGCKGFFRRSVQKNIEYTCHKDEKCTINRITRNRCQACRFKKCLAMGMAREAVRNDRNRKRKVKDEVEEEQLRATARLQQLTAVVVAQHNETMCFAQIEENPVNILAFIKQQLTGVRLNRIVQFATAIPGFSDLVTADQVTLLKAALLEIIMLRCAFLLCAKDVSTDCDSSSLSGSGVFFCSLSNQELVACVSRLRESFLQLQVFHEEVALLAAVCLFCTTRSGLAESEKVEALQEPLLEALRIQVQLRRVNQPHVFAKLLMKVSDLRSLVLKGGSQAVVVKQESCVDGKIRLCVEISTDVR